MTTPAVLITVLDGTADYNTVGDVTVVLVDFDRHNHDVAFPDDLTRDIDAVKALPQSTWRDNVLSQLRTLQRSVSDNIRSQPPEAEDEVH